MTSKAILIGINYEGQQGELKGCINDVKNMYNHLVDIVGLDTSDITILTEEKDSILPTASNILMHLYNAVMKTNKEMIDTLYIHYSGHGTYVRDTDGDESDGKDEAICPLDYGKSGIITDDLLKNIISHVNKNTKVICIFDCCHSGTILDLKYKYSIDNKNCIENKYQNKDIKSYVLMLSGCKDNQTSADAWNINNSNKYSGALTSNLLEILKKYKYNITCYKLLHCLYKNLKDQKYTQLPQISCTKKLNQTSIFCSNKSDPVIHMKCMAKKRKLNDLYEHIGY